MLQKLVKLKVQRGAKIASNSQDGIAQIPVMRYVRMEF